MVASQVAMGKPAGEGEMEESEEVFPPGDRSAGVRDAVLISDVMTYRRRWRGVGRPPSTLVHAVHVNCRSELVADGENVQFGQNTGGWRPDEGSDEETAGGDGRDGRGGSIRRLGGALMKRMLLSWFSISS